MSKNTSIGTRSEIRLFLIFLLYMHVTIVAIVLLFAVVVWSTVWKFGESSYFASIVYNIINYEAAQVAGLLIAAILGIVVAECKTGLLNK